VDDARTIAPPPSDKPAVEDARRLPSWTPTERDDERVWRERVMEGMRPLLERCERLRERGLLE